MDSSPTADCLKQIRTACFAPHRGGIYNLRKLDSQPIAEVREYFGKSQLSDDCDGRNYPFSLFWMVETLFWMVEILMRISMKLTIQSTQNHFLMTHVQMNMGSTNATKSFAKRRYSSCSTCPKPICELLKHISLGLPYTHVRATETYVIRLALSPYPSY